MITAPDLATAALDYAERGWFVIPLHTPTAQGCSCGQSDCASVGKHPRTRNGSKDASRDPATIREWWKRWPDANVGIATGAEFGLLVLDVDGAQGEASLVTLEKEHGPLPDTFTVRTGGGGAHIYFAWPDGADVRNSARKLAAGLDIRGAGGLVVAPPSLHASGAHYETTDGATDLTPCPGWLLSLTQEPGAPQTRQSGPAAGTETHQPIGKGHRRPTLFKLAGKMWAEGVRDIETIIQALLIVNRTFDPPLTETDVRKTAAGIARYPAGAPSGSLKTEFDLVPLGALMARPDAPMDYLVQGLFVAGTVSCIVAKPKVGKSTFARNLALAVSRGEDFLGYKTRQGEVIYFALEERPEEIKADFQAMGATGSEQINIHAATAPEDAMLSLVQLVRERKPVLLVIDPLFRLVRIRDEKAYAETYQALGPLIDVARETGTHILLTHHAGKSTKADAIDAPLGSTALGGIVSTLLVMKRTEGYRTLQSVQRTGAELPETVLSFDTVTRTLSLGAVRAEFEQRDAETSILEYLEGKSEPQTQEQIRDNVEGQTKAIRAALTALVLLKRIHRTGEGKRGKPFFYEKQISGSHHIPGTTEPETNNRPQTCMNTGDILVPKNEHGAMPVLGVRDRLWRDFDSECGGLLQ